MKRACWLVAAAAAAMAAETRGIVPEDFVKARPAATAAAAAHSPLAASKPRYRPMATGKSAAAVAAPTDNLKQIGITVWKLRRSRAADTGARILVQEAANTVELVAERVGATNDLSTGDMVRLSIESAATGYLYVIDRERYANGTTGDAYLIFPTTRTRGGENRVSAGHLIDLPGQEDQPNFFTLRKSRTDQLGEELLVIVSEAPLEGIEIGPKALLLRAEQVAQWEKQWAGRTEKFELAGEAGKPWTRAEQMAAASATRALTQDEPSPQTVYRVASEPGQAALVKVELKLAKR